MKEFNYLELLTKKGLILDSQKDKESILNHLKTNYRYRFINSWTFGNEIRDMYFNGSSIIEHISCIDGKSIFRVVLEKKITEYSNNQENKGYPFKINDYDSSYKLTTKWYEDTVKTEIT